MAHYYQYFTIACLWCKWETTIASDSEELANKELLKSIHFHYRQAHHVLFEDKPLEEDLSRCQTSKKKTS